MSYIKEIKLKNITIKNNVFLAPMAGVTDQAFRKICREFGPGLTFTEMASSKAMEFGSVKTDKLLDLLDDERPSAVQIFGSNPESIRSSILKLNDNDKIDIIDINMGCPAPKLVKNGDGAGLLLNLDNVKRIVDVAVSTSKKIITVKTRRGFDESNITAVKVAKICEELGVSMVTIHGRTREQYYSGKADWDIIRDVKNSVNIPVIGNGDVVDLKSAKDMFEYTGCDGIMIGRGAQGNPWIFKSIIEQREYMTTNEEKLSVILKHIEYMREFEGEHQANLKLRKHLAWYIKSMPNSSEIRNIINTAENVDVLIKIVTKYFDDLKRRKQLKIAFYTLGCKVNQYETDLMKSIFIKKGYDLVDFEDKADIYVVNSCSVTNLSTRKSRMFLSRAKKNNPDSIVVLAGCYSQELSKGTNVGGIKNVDLVIGNEEKNEIANIVDEYLRRQNLVNKRMQDVKSLVNRTSDISKAKKYVLNQDYIKASEVRESVKIEDGCNNFCSYCIIPHLRGRVRSRSMPDILKEVKHLLSNGVKEVVLVGIEIASYGRDFKEDNISLINVIEEVSKVDGEFRIRLGSIEPRWLTDENICRLSKLDKVCNHFHVSVQSLDDSVLKNMNRKYTAEFIEDRIASIRKEYAKVGKNVSLTCDIIVGFPQETDQQFLNTYNMLKKLKFTEIHVFKYSKRDFTIAKDMEGQIDGNIKNYRSNEIINLGNELYNEYIQKLKNTRSKVLLESYDEGKLYGYTSDYIKVVMKGDVSLCKEIVEIELVGQEQSLLVGQMIEEKD